MRSRSVVLCLLVIVLGAGVAAADGSGDIDMDPDPGQGSGSAAPAPTPPEAGQGSGDATPAKDPKVAKKWLTAAQQLVSKGDYFSSHKKPDDAKAQYTNAVTAYQHAIEAGDDITVNYSMALIEDKLGAETDAYAHLKLVVDAQPPVKPDALKKAQQKLEEVTGKIGVVKLAVDPEGTTVTINGKSYGDSPIKDPILLAPGTYTANLVLVGYQPKDVELKVEAGGTVEKKVTLDPLPIQMTPKDKYEPEPEPAPIVAKPSKVVLIAGVSATVVFAAGAGIFGGSAISQHRAYVDPTFTKSERADAQKLGRTMAHLCDASIGVSVLAAAFTVYWYHWKYQKELDAPPPGYQPRSVPKVDMIPWVQPDAGGLAAVGSF